ncbi:MAG: YbjN domain-containing protein [Pseudomonadales bacterium]|jgi:hypothetical protein|nr:YbjN domain-containing protein [Pseudomonadales bacterium]
MAVQRRVLRRRAAVLLSAVLLTQSCAAAPPAPAAAAGVVARLEASGLAGVFEEFGYAAGTVDDDGDLVLEVGGVRVLALVGSYDGEFVLLYAGFSDVALPPEAANAWNRDYRFSKVYIDEAGDPVIEAELDLAGGVTLDRIRDFVRTFTALSLPRFVELLAVHAEPMRSARRSADVRGG